MRLIDADKLEEQLIEKMELQYAVAEEYHILDGEFVKLERGIMKNVLELVKAQPTVKE